MTLRFVLPWPPSLNRMYRTRKGGGVHKSAAAEAYGWQVAEAMAEQGVGMAQGAVSVSLRLYRPQKRGDVDNYSKALLDCLQKRAYQNDNQIVELHIWRYDDKDNPRVEVEIVEAKR